MDTKKAVSIVIFMQQSESRSRIRSIQIGLSLFQVLGVFAVPIRRLFEWRLSPGLELVTATFTAHDTDTSYHGSFTTGMLLVISP